LLTFLAVPIFDACEAGSDFEGILSKLRKVPRYPEDLPSGACAVVGYTVSTFTKINDELPSVSFNIHWAMLLGLVGKSKKIKC
jgi:hypothetical protein